jgi:hypothetical protein
VLVQPLAHKPTPAQPAVRIAQAQYSQTIYGSSKEYYEESKEILKNAREREQAGIIDCMQPVKVGRGEDLLHASEMRVDDDPWFADRGHSFS